MPSRPMRKRSARSLAALAIGALALSPGAARPEEVCAADAARLCAGIPPGEGRIFYCLKANLDRLSDGCQAVVRWAEERAYDVALDCQADIFAWCQGVPPGRGRVFSCLMSRRDSVSSQCRDALTRVSAFASACGGDALRLCPGLTASQGAAVLVCLVARKDELSPQCQAVLWP